MVPLPSLKLCRGLELSEGSSAESSPGAVQLPRLQQRLPRAGGALFGQLLRG